MPALSTLSLSPLPCQCSASTVAHRKSTLANNTCFGNSAGPFKVLSLSHALKGSLFTDVPPPHIGDLTPSLSCFLSLAFCSVALFFPLEPTLAGTVEHRNEESLFYTDIPQHPFAEFALQSPAKAPYVQALNLEENPNVAESVHSPLWEHFIVREKGHIPLAEISVLAEQDSPNSFWLFGNEILFEISSSDAEQPKSFLDFATVFSAARANSLRIDIHTLETETGWRLRVITKSGSSPTISGKDLKDLWKPDEKTIIVIEDVSSPNILNFNAGADVIAKLPRQFFLELQSRYGNQFYVQQEGEGAALLATVQAIQECLRRPGGCKSVPGLTNDLYYLTLSTSIVGGCVFGFAARLAPSGRVEASWQWVVFLSPLWLLLFVAFGILPVVGRTSELGPLLQNTLGFAVGAAALYLTPIFGPSPISKR